MGRLRDKVALVTGGASGIGRATAEQFIAEGARVLIGDLNGEAAEAAASALGEQALGCKMDVTQAADWTSAIETLINTWGRWDVLVNNAGIALIGTIESQSQDEIDQTLAINLQAVIQGTRRAIESMKTSGGSIVNVASIEGIIGEPQAMAYNASKGGVRIFSKSAAKHCATEGYPVRINCICPGFIETPLVANAVASMDEETAVAFQSKVISSIPMGRLGQPAEIAKGIVFLASDDSSFMTGADLVIDGGQTA